MKGLYKILPPFALDYSGVCSTLFELGGIVVIHDVGGCTMNFTSYDEPRWYGSSSTVFSSGLRDVDAVLGDDEKLLLKIEEAIYNLRKSQFVAIVGSPSPMVIGTDYTALAKILEQRTGLPVLVFDTNGMNYYDDGASIAFLELARRFVKPVSTPFETGVNIIGATPLDIGNNRHVRKIKSLLTDAGCRIVSCWAMDSTLDEIAQSAHARLNIVVSHVGLEAARYMECEYGMPYLTGITIGRVPTSRFVSSIRSSLGLCSRSDMRQNVCTPFENIRDTLVVGEQVMSNSIRDCLRLDIGLDKVTVASFFGMDSSLMEKDDIYLDSEGTLTILTTKHHYDIIVGDPLYHGLITSSMNSYFVDFPHIAVSSRLHWDSDLDYIGEDGLYYFESKLNEIGK